MARRNLLSRRAFAISGREDSNLRPPEPHYQGSPRKSPAIPYNSRVFHSSIFRIQCVKSQQFLCILLQVAASVCQTPTAETHVGRCDVDATEVRFGSCKSVGGSLAAERRRRPRSRTPPSTFLTCANRTNNPGSNESNSAAARTLCEAHNVWNCRCPCPIVRREGDHLLPWTPGASPR
jgi:hypothetical protein